MNLAEEFVSESRRYLLSEYLPKIRKCVDALSRADIWWRPNEESNSIGNLILHLCGNVRQWIVSGVGGEADNRDRQTEFDERIERSGEELLDLLASTLNQAEDVLRKLDLETLGTRRRIQGHDVTVFEAIYHVVEHFAMHAGQIVYLAKLRTGRDLHFYSVKDGIAKPNW